MLLFVFVAIAYAKTVNLSFYVDYLEVTHGNYTKTVVGISFEGESLHSIGPTIRVTKGDLLKINILNKLSNEYVTIHWHGIHMHGTPYADGVGYVTQYPIGSLETMMYEFTVNKEGTYWYHSHIEPQRDDACFGALIVEPLESYQFHYDEERILILSDFYSQDGNTQSLHLSSSPTVWVGSPQYLLMNGESNYTVTLQSNKTYLIRLISAATISQYNFVIPKHNLTIVKVESSLVIPYVTSNIWINAGERYSFLLNPIKGCYSIGFDALNSETKGNATLVVDDIDSTCVWYNNTNVFNSILLRTNNTSIPNATRFIKITTDSILVKERLMYLLNGNAYKQPVIPILLAYYYNIEVEANVIPLIPNEVVDIFFVNDDNKQHPIHIHGHSFWILCDSTYPNANIINPVKRDTFTLPSGGWTRVRLQANNPGVWMIHCHVSWHVMMGMGLLLSYPKNTIPSPPKGFPSKDIMIKILEGKLDYLQPLAYVAVSLLSIVVLTSLVVVFRRVCVAKEIEEQRLFNGYTIDM